MVVKRKSKKRIPSKACKQHAVKFRLGNKAVAAKVNCHGKVALTRAGRKTFTSLKCKCRAKQRRGAWARKKSVSHRKNKRSVGNEGGWFAFRV